MVGFPKNPLAGPNPFRDAEGRNPFRDGAAPAAAGEVPSSGAESAGHLAGTAATNGTPDDDLGAQVDPRMRAYERGDFSPLASLRSGRIRIASYAALILFVMGCLGLAFSWFVVTLEEGIWLGAGVWFVLSAIFASVTWFWSRAELTDIRLGAIDPRSEDPIRAARRRVRIILVLALIGLLAVVASVWMELVDAV